MNLRSEVQNTDTNTLTWIFINNAILHKPRRIIFPLHLLSLI